MMKILEYEIRKGVKHFKKEYGYFLHMGPLGLIMQTSNSYWWMMQVGESRMAYRRSNTLRCLARGGTGCGHTLESLTNERRRCKDRKVPISQAKGQSIKKRSYDFFVLVLG